METGPRSAASWNLESRVRNPQQLVYYECYYLFINLLYYYYEYILYDLLIYD